MQNIVNSKQKFSLHQTDMIQMKKYILFPLLIALFFIGNLFAQNFDPPKSPYKEMGSPLPPFRMVDKKNKTHTDSEFKKDGTVFLFLFNPGCEHCINMANTIHNNEELFKGSNVYFVAASDMLPYFDNFYLTTHADNFKYIHVGVDSSDIVRNIYKYGTLPQLNIYDKKERKLLKTFSGDTPVDSIIAYIGK